MLVVVKISIESTQRGVFKYRLGIIGQRTISSNGATNYQFAYPCLCRGPAGVPCSSEIDTGSFGKRHAEGASYNKCQVYQRITASKRLFYAGIANILLVEYQFALDVSGWHKVNTNDLLDVRVCFQEW